MNNLSRFDRNKILVNSEYTNILSPCSLYFQKNKTFNDITQEEGKSNLILNTNNNNLNSYTGKNSKVVNLMFDYKNNINKKKKNNLLYNYTNHLSPKKVKKMNKIEENKNEFCNYKKVNKILGKNIEINHAFNQPSSKIISKYYSNNNKIFVQKKQNSSINFNLNSPSENNCINSYNTYGRNPKLNKQFKSTSIMNLKYKTYSNINELYSAHYNPTEYDSNRYSIINDKTKLNDKNEISNMYLNIPSSSNIYLNTENNINSRNISTKKLNGIHNKNYNLMNIDNSTDRNNTYSNINSENFKNNNDSKRRNKNNNQCKNIKYSFKTKNSYISRESKISKDFLKHYYEQTFNDIINENVENKINEEKKEYKFNNEDLDFNNILLTNYSNYNNEMNKVNKKEIKKQYKNNKQFANRNSKNPELFHFYMVSYLQKGKLLGNNFN